VVRQARAIGRALEGKDRLQVPAELERDLGGDLVGAVGDRRDEAELGREAGEAVALGIEQSAAGLLDPLQHVAHPLAKDRHAALGKHVGAMAGHSDGEDERDWRRSGYRLRRGLRIQRLDRLLVQTPFPSKSLELMTASTVVVDGIKLAYILVVQIGEEQGVRKFFYVLIFVFNPELLVLLRAVH